VIDNSSAYRMEPWAELVIPEVNPEALERGAKVYAVPNCTIITALMALAPLHRAAGLESVSLSSYQSVSGAGAKGVRELVEQIEKLHGMEDDLAHPDPAALPVGEVFGKTIAYNVLAKIDVFDPESGSTFEEIKVVREGRRILSIPELDFSATCVRVPVPVGHSVSLHAGFGRPISVGEAREALEAAEGVQLRDDPANDVYPSPCRGHRRDARRPDPSARGSRRRAAALRLRRQPPQGRRAQRGPDRRTRLRRSLTTPGPPPPRASERTSVRPVDAVTPHPVK
jgi:aspartate-semialdehyde dehydrogenase